MIVQDNCEQYLIKYQGKEFDLSFLDPPFNQGKAYNSHDDNMRPDEYWTWMERVCKLIFEKTSPGGCIYFMQREKNTKYVLEILDSTGWTYQNLIIWKKKSSAVPQRYRNGKQYQIIVFATKGTRPRVFNRLRIDPPLLVTEKYKRENGLYVTDVWDNIRELTSGYFAGNEPIRDNDGTRLHEQQAPVALLLRIILSSTMKSDLVLDPFAGTGTTYIVASQLKRNSIAIEIDPLNSEIIKKRVAEISDSDNIIKYRKEYICTDNLDEIWKSEIKTMSSKNGQEQLKLINS